MKEMRSIHNDLAETRDGRTVGSSSSHVDFRFLHALPAQRPLIHQWLNQQHIKERIHGVGLSHSVNGLEEFFKGDSKTLYWIGYDKETPFAFLITSFEGSDAINLDLFICDVNYLGKGLAVAMIHTFLITHFSNIERVLIDPEAANRRAIHVYKKAGFIITGEFIASWHPVPHFQMELSMKNLISSFKKEK